VEELLSTRHKLLLPPSRQSSNAVTSRRRLGSRERSATMHNNTHSNPFGGPLLVA